jgi:hypothetical protein
MHAQDDDSWTAIELLRSGGDFDSIQSGHSNVENHEVGMMLFHQPHGLKTIRGFSHDCEVSFFQQAPQPSTHNAVIIREQDAQAAPP